MILSQHYLLVCIQIIIYVQFFRNDLNNQFNFQILDSDIPICSSGMPHQNRPGENCIPRDSLMDVGLLIKRLHPILKKKIVVAECDGINENPYINTAQIIKTFITSPSVSTKEHVSLFYNKSFTANNKYWSKIFLLIAWGITKIEKSFEIRILSDI